MELLVYYDNPNEASDMYLKWLKKDCEEQGIEVTVIDSIVILKERLKEGHVPVLPLMPCKEAFTEDDLALLLNKYPMENIDNIGGASYYEDATAEGIYDFIKGEFPSRETTIAVIGRGKVGNSLITQLIKYGYTVIEFNSKSNYRQMYQLCFHFADVVVGLSSEHVFGPTQAEVLSENGTVLIDSGNNFDTKSKLRCGKWTRKKIIDRIKSVYSFYY